MKTSVFSKVVTFLLVLSILILPIRVQAQDKGKDDPEPKVAACGVAIGVLVLAGGVVVVIKLKDWCDRIVPPLEPPPPPPPVVITNTPCTNCPPTNTFAKMWKSEVNPPVLVLAEQGMEKLDVYSYGWKDMEDFSYHTLIRGTVQTSTNLSNWKAAFEMRTWISAAHLLTVIYDSNGIPVSTNYTAGATNETYVELPAASPPPNVSFFRVAPAL